MAEAGDYTGALDAPRRDRLRVAMLGLRGIPASYGGIEKAVESLSVELATLGHDVTVYARRSYVQGAGEYRGVRVRSLPSIDTKHLEAASHTFLALLDAVASRRFDMIHIHAAGPALFSFMPRLARVPCVATIHALDSKREKWGAGASRALELGLRAAVTYPRRTIVVSQTLQEHIRERFGRSTTYIPNGVDEAEFDETSPVSGLGDRPFVLFLGRLVPEKGVQELIRAFSRTNLDADLAIVGPSSHTSAYVEQLERVAAPDPRVRMLGPRYGAEKAWLLRNADVVVNPSALEGMPILLLEAAICRRPCIVSDIPEHLELVRNGETPLARTFAVGDEQDLAAALEAHFADPRRHDAGVALHRTVAERYRWTKIAGETERVYREAVDA